MGKWANTAERIIAKHVTKTEGCWLWTGYLMPNGYGQVSLNDKRQLAHRVVFEALRGAIPKGLQLDHLCRNRACVNPDHLEAVTQQINILRGERPTKLHCVHGHALYGPNLYVCPRGKRKCRTCKREADKQRLQAKRAA